MPRPKGPERKQVLIRLPIETYNVIAKRAKATDMTVPAYVAGLAIGATQVAEQLAKTSTASAIVNVKPGKAVVNGKSRQVAPMFKEKHK